MEPSVITTASVHSQPNPAATRTRESMTSFNLNYVTSFSGLLKVLEFIFGLITWALIASRYISVSSAHQFVMFVTITSWLTTTFLLFVFLCGCHENACSQAPWLIVEFCHNSLWALLYLSAACVIAANNFQISQLIAATVFAFIVTAFYIVHAFTSFRDWKGRLPWN